MQCLVRKSVGDVRVFRGLRGSWLDPLGVGENKYVIDFILVEKGVFILKQRVRSICLYLTFIMNKYHLEKTI